MNIHNGPELEPEDLRARLAALRRGGLALAREGGRIRRAEVDRCWRALAADLRARELEERGRARLALLEGLLAALERGGAGGAAARLELEGALLEGLRGLLAALAALRRPALEELEPGDLRAALAALEGALLEGLAGAGGERLEVSRALRARLEREGSGALLLRSGSGRAALELQEARGWRAALAAGLEELLRARDRALELEELRRSGARAGGAPALPAALALAGEGLLLPRRICGAGAEGLEELELEGALLLWTEGGRRPPAAVCAGVPEELLRAGGAALSGAMGDLLLRDLARRAALERAAGGSGGLIRYSGGLAGLRAALAGLEPEELEPEELRRWRGGREVAGLRAALEVGQRLRLRLPVAGGGWRWIGGLWTWELLEGGRSGSVLELAPAPILQPGAREGALLPVLLPPLLPSAPAYRAPALRLQWRWLAALRRGLLEELRRGLEPEGLAPIPPGERLRAALELGIPPAPALELDRRWRSAGGWLEELAGGRWRMTDRAGERLLREGAALAARGRRG